MGKFGPAVSASDVEVAVRDVLRTWIHTYLGEFERETSWPLYPAQGCIPRPRSYARTSGPADEIHDRQIPRIVIRSPGASDFVETGGALAAWFVIGVAVIVRGQKAEHTRRLAQDYIAATRRLLMQMPTVSDVIQSVRLEAETADVIDVARERTHAGGEIVLSVLVADVVDPFQGPGDNDIPVQPAPPADGSPDEEPPDFGDWPTVETVETTVINVQGELP